MSFLKADKEARALETKEDREERVKQRAEDLKHIEMMIKIGVNKEVNAALKPLQDRLGEQERTVEDLTMQLSSIMKEVTSLKATATVCSQAEYPALQQPRLDNQQQIVNQGLGENGEGGVPGGDRLRQNDKLQAKNICAAARRVFGLTPIEPRMLDIQIKSYGAQNKQEAMLLEVKSYLKCELKVPPSVIEKLDIVNVFHPAKDDWNALYVELGSDMEVDTLYSYTRNIMKKDHRVFPYIPKELYRRYRAAESVLYNVRHEEKVKTKVKIGTDDLILATKAAGTSYWRSYPIPSNLPPIEIQSTEPLSFLKKNLIV